MRIEFPKSEEEEDEIILEQIAYGEVFSTDTTPNEIYMKTKEKKIPAVHKTFVVELLDGTMIALPDETVVHPIKGFFKVTE